MEQTLAYENNEVKNFIESEAQKPYVVNVRNLPTKVESEAMFNEQYVTSAFVVGMSLMAVYIIIAYLFNFSLYYSALIGMGALLFYVCTIFYMFQPRKVVKVINTIVKDMAYPTIVYVDRPVEVEKLVEVEKIVERPVMQEVVKYVERQVIEYVDRAVEVEKIVEKPVIEYVDREVEVEKLVEVEKPVVKEVTRYIERPVIEYVPQYMPRKRIKQKKKLNIPKFKYLASSQTKRYHRKSCRLGKLIKKKYKLNSKSLTKFKKKKFKACKNCFRRK